MPFQPTGPASLLLLPGHQVGEVAGINLPILFAAVLATLCFRCKKVMTTWH
jgi:hypothetical protein